MALSDTTVDWPGAEFLCGCNGESLRVCVNEDGEVELSFWSFGFHNGRLRWRDRPRWIWRVLTRGLPFADQVILDKEQTARLSMLLNQVAGVWTTSGGSTASSFFKMVDPYKSPTICEDSV